MPPDRGAAALLRGVGLLADGPVPWGRPLPATGAGVYVVELSAPLSRAPLSVARLGKWIERVPELRLDGERPTSRALAARLASFWLPSETVLYVGATSTSVSRRVAAHVGTVLGDRRPAAGGHWVHALDLPAGVHVWWAATSAIEEYEDALLGAFGDGVPDTDAAALPDPAVVLPFANLRRTTGERKPTGLTGALLPEPVEPARPPTRVVQLPDGDAEGARGEPPEPRRRRTTARPATRSPEPASPPPPDPGVDALTPDGAARLRAELDELTRVKRPEVIARIRAAKELGDLKENADYTAAREEQSFLEGRVQAIEARLRLAVIVDAPAAGARIGLGSSVTVEIEDETIVYEIVGASDSDVAAGRISSASPVGRALMGRSIGDVIEVATPAGARHYTVVDVS